MSSLPLQFATSNLAPNAGPCRVVLRGVIELAMQHENHQIQIYLHRQPRFFRLFLGVHVWGVRISIPALPARSNPSAIRLRVHIARADVLSSNIILCLLKTCSYLTSLFLFPWVASSFPHPFSPLFFPYLLSVNKKPEFLAFDILYLLPPLISTRL
jgi:hypothetical protein